MPQQLIECRPDVMMGKPVFKGTRIPVELVLRKVGDRRLDLAGFLTQLEQRRTLVQTKPACRKDFLHEMRRFLPPAVVSETLEQDAFWIFLVNLVAAGCEQIERGAHSAR